MFYKYKLTRLDGGMITENIGKDSINCLTIHEPTEGLMNNFFCDNETCDSMGAHIFVANLEKVGDEYRFFNGENIQYKAEFLGMKPAAE